MKKTISIVAAALALFAVSCAKYEVTDAGHKSGDPDLENCYGVYFPKQEASGDHTYDPSQEPFVEIQVGRKGSMRKGEITVPYEIVTDSLSKNIFKGGDLKFANGDSLATLKIDFSAAEVGKKYAFTVKVTDPQYASSYGTQPTSLDFSCMRVQWVKFGTGALSVYGPLGGTAARTIKGLELWYYEVGSTRTCKIVNGLPNLNANPPYDADYQFTWNIKTNRIYVPYQRFGYVEDGVDAYITDAKAYYVFKYGEDYWTGSSSYTDWYDYCEKNELLFAEYDGNGGFYLADWYLCDQVAMIGYGWQFGAKLKSDCDLFVCDGFTRTDYKVKEIESDYTQQGVVPIKVKTGKSAQTLRFVTVQGELSNKIADQIVAEVRADSTKTEIKAGNGVYAVKVTEGPVYDPTEDVNVFSLGLSFEESGSYTILAITLDPKDNTKVYSESAQFDYISKKDTDANAVKLSLGTEDTPERYGLTKRESFAYYIIGEDVTALSSVIVDYNTFASKVTAIKAALRAGGDYAASEEVIAQVNSKGGYYNVASGLKADTQYVLVVWATNGTLDTYKAVAYVTEPLPYEWKLLGEGIYTDDSMFPMYSMDPIQVPVKVYLETTNKSKTLYKISGISKQLFMLAFEIPEEAADSYKGNYWRDADIIIDATNPKSLVWELQDYGICFNPEEGFLDGITNMYQGKPFSVGTLSNGVMAWPTAKGMLCTINGDGYYYANINGKTSLVLPEAVKAADLAAVKANCGKGTATSLKSFKSNSSLRNANKNVLKSRMIPAVKGRSLGSVVRSVDCKVVKLPYTPSQKASVNGKAKCEITL